MRQRMRGKPRKKEEGKEIHINKRRTGREQEERGRRESHQLLRKPGTLSLHPHTHTHLSTPSLRASFTHSRRLFFVVSCSSSSTVYCRNLSIDLLENAAIFSFPLFSPFQRPALKREVYGGALSVKNSTRQIRNVVFSGFSL